MQDLAQVTVYALYLWIVASLLWMWRSVLRNRRARKLAVEQGEPGAHSSETMTDSDEMMSTGSTSAAPADDSDLDLRGDSTSADSAKTRSVDASKVTADSLENSKAERVLASTTKQASSEASSGSLPEEATKPAEQPHKTPADKSHQDHPKSDLPESDQPDQPSTIAGHLSGIRLPYDLLPMVPNGEKASDQRVSLVSDGAQPEVVGAAIADELERLGYSIETLATDEAVAVRQNQTLGLQIHPKASELSNDAGSRFPEAVDGSVVIDLWVK